MPRPPTTDARPDDPPGEPAPLAARQELTVARQIRARELVTGAPADVIAARIHAECGPVFGTTWVRAYRLALGIALADVVAQVKAIYQAEGRKLPRFSETLLSAYESGHKRPGPEYLHYLCAVYRTDPMDLGYQGRCLCGRDHRVAGRAPAWPGPAGTRGSRAREYGRAGRGRGDAHIGREDRAEGPAGADADGPAGADADGPAGADADGDDEVLYSTLLRLLADEGADVDGAFFGAVDRLRRRMDEALLSGRVSATLIDRMEEASAGHARQYMTTPPLRLLCDALLDFGDVRRVCAERQPVESAERLCRLAARLAGLAGIALIDVGDQRLARSFFRTARTAADETGDRRLRAWVAVREALVPLHYGDPREALSLAGSAADLAGRNPCAAGAMAPVVAARAMARLAGHGRRGPLDRARALLDSAHDALGDLPDAERADTAYGYTERQLYFHEGDALITLGDWRRAEQAFTQALHLYSPDEFLDRSLATLGHAWCLLESGEPEQALRMSRETLLGLPRGHRPLIVERAARSLGRSAAARHARLPAVQEYHEALLTC